jgi:hypothetical protein
MKPKDTTAKMIRFGISAPPTRMGRIAVGGMEWSISRTVCLYRKMARMISIPPPNDPE